MMFHRHKMRINRIGRLSISVFLYTFAIAIIWPMYPLFIRHLCGSDAMVGIVYGVTSLFGLVFCLLSGELMQKYGRGFVLTVASVMLGACFVVLTLVNNIADLLIVESMRVMAVTSVFIALNVLVKTCSKKDDLENSEGEFYTFANVAWLVAPVLSGFIFMRYGWDAIFLIAALFVVISFMSLEKSNLKNHRVNGNLNFHYIRAHVINKSFLPATYYVGVKTIVKELRMFVKNKNLVLIYFISFGLFMLFSTQWIYLPVILDSFGTSRLLIGIMTGALVVPLIIFEIPFTRLSKRVGTKNFISLGFVIASVAMTYVYFFYSEYSVVALFMVAVVGAAMIEPFKDAYILKHTPPHKVDVFFGIFKTSRHLGYIVAPVINSVSILFLGLNGMFLVIGPVFLVFAVAALRLE